MVRLHDELLQGGSAMLDRLRSSRARRTPSGMSLRKGCTCPCLLHTS